MASCNIITSFNDIQGKASYINVYRQHGAYGWCFIIKRWYYLFNIHQLCLQTLIMTSILHSNIIKAPAEL